MQNIVGSSFRSGSLTSPLLHRHICNQQTGVTSQRWGLYRGDVVAVPVARHWSVRPTLTAARLPIRATSTDALFYPQFGRRLTSECRWLRWRGRRTCLGRVVNTVWTDNIDNKLCVWTIPCLCLWWSSLGVGHIYVLFHFGLWIIHDANVHGHRHH